MLLAEIIQKFITLSLVYILTRVRLNLILQYSVRHRLSFHVWGVRRELSKLPFLITSKGYVMSSIAACIWDARRKVHTMLTPESAEILLAALAADPDTLPELEQAFKRFPRNRPFFCMQSFADFFSRAIEIDVCRFP